MPKKILLADDSITIQKVVELTFSDGDYEVTAVNNGAKAVQKLAEMRPDIILSDIIMPEKNGYEVCEYVKSHPEFRNIPVVLLTGTFEPFDPDRAEKAGCDAVVTKPFESQSLIHKVEELIAQAQANSAAAPEPMSAPAPVEVASPWMDDAPPAPEPFTHDADIFAAAPPTNATTEMPFEIPPTPSFGGDASFASSADTPFGEPAGEAFGGETRAFPRMTFEEMQQMAATPPPPPPPAPEPSPWDEPAGTGGETRAFTKMSFDDFQASAPAPVPAPEPEADTDSPFGAPPPIEEFSSETRAFPRMSLEEMQQMTSGGISVDQPSPAPEAPAPPPIEETPVAASPWDEQDTPAFGGETRAFPKLNFDDFQQQPEAPAPPAEPAWNAPSFTEPSFSEPADSPFGSDAPAFSNETPAFGSDTPAFGNDAPAFGMDAPAFGGETRAFPKLNFDDFQQADATPEPQPEAPVEAASAWDSPAAPEPAELFDNGTGEPLAEAASPFGAAEASTFEEPAAAPEPEWMAPPAEDAGWMSSPAPEEPADAPVEAPSGFTDQPMPEDLPFAAEPVESIEQEAPAAEEPAWSLAEGGAEVAQADAEPDEPPVVPAPAALAPEAPPMPIAARSSDLPSDLTDEQVDRIARRVVELLSDQVVRNIAWEVIPDLAEMVVKERIRQLEAEA